MRYRKKHHWALLLLLVVPTFGRAQEICIPESATVRQVKGQVLFGFEGKSRPQEGVTIQLLRDKGTPKVLATATSDPEGRFVFKGIKAGQYLLRTKHSQIIGLEVRLKVIPANKSANDVFVVLVLGADALKPCGGGHVEFASSLPKT